MPPTVEARAAQTAPPVDPPPAEPRSMVPVGEIVSRASTPRPVLVASMSPASLTAPDAAFSSSGEVDQLVIGLAAAQLAFAAIERTHTADVKSKSGASYSYDYADLATVLRVVRPALAEQGIAIIQAPAVVGKVVTITTFLVHASGQFLRNVLPCNIESCDPQTIGSAITYMRRYSLMSLLGVAPEQDDDGALATPQARREQAGQSGQPVRPGQGPVQMPQRQPATPPLAGAPAPGAAPASSSAGANPAVAPAPAPVTIVALDGTRLSANRNRFWMVELSDGRKACTFSTTIGAALERGFANRTVYDDIVTHRKDKYLYVDELLPQAGGAQ